MPPKRTAITTTPMIDAAIKALIAQEVADALAEYEAHRSSGNRDDSYDSGSGRRTKRVARECTYSDFLKCQPLNFKDQVATCTLLGNPLTWWNSHVKTVGHDAAYGMPWKILKKMMTDKYCPRGEIKKLEIELWNLKVKDEVEKYVRGLLDMIQGSVMASKPKTMQDAIEFATELMDKKIRSLADRQAENKRKLDDTSSNNQKQQ
ncbi:reverse transcriptase domain-containing protein [Tanacetum coccineum]